MPFKSFLKGIEGTQGTINSSMKVEI